MSATKSVLMVWRREKFLSPAGNRIPALQPVARPYTARTAPAIFRPCRNLFTSCFLLAQQQSFLLIFFSFASHGRVSKLFRVHSDIPDGSRLHIYSFECSKTLDSLSCPIPLKYVTIFSAFTLSCMFRDRNLAPSLRLPAYLIFILMFAILMCVHL